MGTDMISNTNDAFLRLLRISTTGIATDEDCYALKGTDWNAIFELAMSQLMVGMIYRALTIIPREKGPERAEFLQWFGRNNVIEYLNGTVNKDAVALCKKLEEDGFRCTVLKGQGVGMLYDEPLKRCSGDIDVWVDKSIDEVVEYVRKEIPGLNVDVSAKHIEFPLFKDCVVEIHFVPSHLSSPSADKALQSFYQKEASAQFENVVALPNGVGEIKAATVKFDAVHVLAHIFGHVFYEGIGIRQYMDYYYVLKRLDEADRQEVVEVLKRIGMSRFASGVMFVMQEVFGLDREYMLMEPNARLGRKLLNDIMVNGNLSVENNSHNKSAAKRFAEHTLRQMMFIDMCPGEALWSPINRVKHYLWRKRKGYFRLKA